MHTHLAYAGLLAVTILTILSLEKIITATHESEKANNYVMGAFVASVAMVVFALTSIVMSLFKQGMPSQGVRYGVVISSVLGMLIASVLSLLAYLSLGDADDLSSNSTTRKYLFISFIVGLSVSFLVCGWPAIKRMIKSRAFKEIDIVDMMSE